MPDRQLVANATGKVAQVRHVTQRRDGVFQQHNGQVLTRLVLQAQNSVDLSLGACMLLLLIGVVNCTAGAAATRELHGGPACAGQLIWQRHRAEELHSCGAAGQREFTVTCRCEFPLRRSGCRRKFTATAAAVALWTPAALQISCAVARWLQQVSSQPHPCVFSVPCPAKWTPVSALFIAMT